jgi:two-component system sensor histidine kinase RegB
MGGRLNQASQAVATGHSIERADRNTLLLIRCVAVGAQTVALGLTIHAPHRPLPLVALALISFLFVVSSLLVQERIRRKSVADDAAFFRQILIDIAVLTYLLALSGGPANPFHDMYVLPVTIAAASLPAAYVWRTAAAVVGCYGFLEFVHVPLPGDEPIVEALVRFGEMSDHLLLATLISYFVLRLSKGLRERDRQLGEAHEREIRAGCAIALGSVAAGAAHELTTPLSTISTVVGELRAERAQRPELVRNLELLQASLSACLLCLRDLRASGEAWLRGGEAIAADRFLDEVISRFRDLRPGAHVCKVYSDQLPAPAIVPDLAVQQAVVNLLSNAASVSPLDITLTAAWDAHNLVVRVCDKGPGISPDVAARLGRVFVTTKPPDAGNGIGLFLTNVTITRLGGHLRLFNAADGGAVAEICVPLASLQKKERLNEQFA